MSKVSFDVSNFFSNDHQSSFDSVFKRCEVISGKTVSFQFLKNFSFFSKLNTQKWFKPLLFDVSTYPRLVKLFYANFSFFPNEVMVSSLVKGINLHCSVQGFKKLLGLSNSGIKIGTMSSHPEFDKGEAYRLLDIEETSGSLKSNMLNPEMKVLHYIVASCLCQKVRNFDRITPTELMLMYFILKGKQINLGFLIVTQIKKHHATPQKSLPYGGYLTTVFKNMDVDFSTEEYVQSCEMMSEKVLFGMGLKKINDTWTWTGKSGQGSRQSDNKLDSILSTLSSMGRRMSQIEEKLGLTVNLGSDTEDEDSGEKQDDADLPDQEEEDEIDAESDEEDSIETPAIKVNSETDSDDVPLVTRMRAKSKVTVPELTQVTSETLQKTINDLPFMQVSEDQPLAMKVSTVKTFKGKNPSRKKKNVADQAASSAAPRSSAEEATREVPTDEGAETGIKEDDFAKTVAEGEILLLPYHPFQEVEAGASTKPPSKKRRYKVGSRKGKRFQ